MYDELKALARRRLAHGANAAIDITGLVRETCLELSARATLEPHDCGH